MKGKKKLRYQGVDGRTIHKWILRVWEFGLDTCCSTQL
jgi:hypothetical protein